MTSRALFPLLAFAVLACTAHAPFTRVVVADRRAILRTISDPQTLQAFERVWQSRKKTEPLEQADWQYKLMIGAADQTSVWLYDPRGYTSLLTVKNAAVYRLPDYATFNSLLGVPNNAAAADAGRGAE